MDNPGYQVSPMHGVERSWADEHLDHEILQGKVRSTRQAQLELEKQRGHYVAKVGLGRYFRFRSSNGAMFQVPAAFATQTSEWLKELLEEEPKTRILKVEVEDRISLYVIDRIIEYWTTLNLHVAHQKIVQHATSRPPDRGLLDVTATLSSLDTLLQIIRAGFLLRDKSLINAALAAARYRIIHGTVEIMECVKLLNQVYTVKGFNEEHEKVTRRLMLTAIVLMWSRFKYPGVVRDELTKAMSCKELQDDMIHAEKWVRS